MRNPDDNIDLLSLGTFCIINGQQWLHDTEQALYEYLINNGCYPLVLDNLFEHPEKIAAIKYFNPDTIILGTTGTYRDKIDKVLATFNELNWLPKNAVFTMGSEYLSQFSDMGVIGYKVYPYARYFKDLPVVVKLESYEF